MSKKPDVFSQRPVCLKFVYEEDGFWGIYCPEQETKDDMGWRVPN